MKLEEIELESRKYRKKLEKDDGQVWKDDNIVYIEERIYILNNWKIQEQIL